MLFPEDVNVDRPRWVVISAIWSASQFSARGPARGGGEPTICVHIPEIYKTALKMPPLNSTKTCSKKNCSHGVWSKKYGTHSLAELHIVQKYTYTVGKQKHARILQTFSCKIGSNATAYLGVWASAVLRLQTLVWVVCSSRMQEESSSGSHSTREHDRGISCRGTRSCENDRSQAGFLYTMEMYLMMKSRWVVLNHQMRVHI